MGEKEETKNQFQILQENIDQLKEETEKQNNYINSLIQETQDFEQQIGQLNEEKDNTQGEKNQDKQEIQN
jgi:uncharacterized coiled-coil DUF342 family protein